MVEKICIICMEKCNDKYCKCQAYFHKECYEEWMKSNFNMNKGVCPHCKEELVIKEKNKCCEIFPIFIKQTSLVNCNSNNQ